MDSITKDVFGNLNGEVTEVSTLLTTKSNQPLPIIWGEGIIEIPSSAYREMESRQKQVAKILLHGDFHFGREDTTFSFTSDFSIQVTDLYPGRETEYLIQIGNLTLGGELNHVINGVNFIVFKIVTGLNQEDYRAYLKLKRRVDRQERLDEGEEGKFRNLNDQHEEFKRMKIEQYSLIRNQNKGDAGSVDLF